jgi:hypothetical protein
VYLRQAGRKDAVLSKLGLRQLHLRAQMGVEVEEEESRERNLLGRPLAKLPLRLSVARRNQRAERKRVKRLPRLLALNNAS